MALKIGVGASGRAEEGRYAERLDALAAETDGTAVVSVFSGGGSGRWSFAGLLTGFGLLLDTVPPR